MGEPEGSYSGWSPDALIDRVKALERELQETKKRYGLQDQLAHLTQQDVCPSAPTTTTPPRPAKKARTLDWSKYSTRFIALKFAYLGKRYNGFEHHANNTTPLPTVEETLWKALMKARLISPSGDVSGKRNAIDWEGCDYSKCGRTDKGVSAFGQVIGLRVRSNRPPRIEVEPARTESTVVEPTAVDEHSTYVAEPVLQADAFDDLNDEIPYCQVLNNILPPDIRMLAWCPTPPPNFSARFSCRERRYIYFFTQPAFTPTPGRTGFGKALTHGGADQGPRREAWLDIGRMQDAARRFEGLHDFRNFCKIDGSKQISDFRRRVFHAEIREVTAQEQSAVFVGQPPFSEFASANKALAAQQAADPAGPKTFVFDLRGSAFLWHQVRHMVAVLFLVGQGLEEPAVIDSLLDGSQHPEKPMYEMAEETPLVLWDCIFSAEDDSFRRDMLHWIHVGEAPRQSGKRGASNTRGRFGIGGLVNETWRLWRERKMDEILAGGLLGVATGPIQNGVKKDLEEAGVALSGKSDSQRVYQGGDEAVYRGQYVPLMSRRCNKAPEVVNREYAEKHGLPMKEHSGGAEGPRMETRRDHMGE